MNNPFLRLNTNKPDEVDWDTVFGGGSSTKPLAQPSTRGLGVNTDRNDNISPFQSRNPFRQPSPAAVEEHRHTPQIVLQTPPQASQVADTTLESLEYEEIELQLRLLQLRKQRLLSASPRHVVSPPASSISSPVIGSTHYRSLSAGSDQLLSPTWQASEAQAINAGSPVGFAERDIGAPSPIRRSPDPRVEQASPSSDVERPQSFATLPSAYAVDDDIPAPPPYVASNTAAYTDNKRVETGSHEKRYDSSTADASPLPVQQPVLNEPQLMPRTRSTSRSVADRIKAPQVPPKISHDDLPAHDELWLPSMQNLAQHSSVLRGGSLAQHRRTHSRGTSDPSSNEPHLPLPHLMEDRRRSEILDALPDLEDDGLSTTAPGDTISIDRNRPAVKATEEGGEYQDDSVNSSSPARRSSSRVERVASSHSAKSWRAGSDHIGDNLSDSATSLEWKSDSADTSEPWASQQSLTTVSSADRQLALEIAAEEASGYTDESQLAALHPMLQDQFTQAMKHYMPLEDSKSGATTSHDSSKPGDGTDIPSYPQSLTLSEQQRQTANNQKVMFLDTSMMRYDNEKRSSKSWTQKGAGGLSKLLTRFITPDPVISRPGNPIVKANNFLQITAGEQPSSTQGESEEEEEDLCYCGKATVGKDTTHYCWPCDGAVYCDACWDIPPPHRDNHKRSKFSRSRGQGVLHEKSEPGSARKIVDALNPDYSIEVQAALHQNDEDTAWFGTGRDPDTGDTVFQDFGRFPRLVADMAQTNMDLTRYPALVSFVGQTGAGKSSLIRLLVELNSQGASSPQVPVIGSTRRSDLPTSGDVHLYADLQTFESEQPILYADCEGLEGGEREPCGARLKKDRLPTTTGRQRTNSFARNIRRQYHTSEREILWATDTLRKSREYHVRHLYPRLLYTFSDVIVFVMKNYRVVESVIEQLLRWAADALETSSNQPVLPHAIIVLNAHDSNSDPALWEANESTIQFLESVGRALHQNHNIRKFAEFWRQKGRQIETIEMLLLSYYASIRVVRVPERGRPKLIDEQVQRLYTEVTESCNKSRASKHRLRMLLDADNLQPYLQYAFDHFSRNLDHPFDFVQASLAHNPTTSDLGGNILKLAIDIAAVWKDKLDAVSIFTELSYMVASCIMLECARSRTLGPADKMLGAYVQHWDTALQDFCDKHWPCEYVHVGTKGRCVNVKTGHTKGHQLKDGKVLSVGEYQSDFTFEKHQHLFQYCLLEVLRKLQKRLSDATMQQPQLELEKALEIHRKIILAPFFKHLHGSKQFINHKACYACLVAPPEHPLPCGHVLCTPCIKGFGSQRGRTLWEIDRCPMHSDDEEGGQFHTRWPIHIKPAGAGVRILTLDGGGVRGIIELTMLRELERKLGAGLPLQLFFDLIIGTSTGGIIALGLGANGWRVDRCLKMFEQLCKKSFTKRTGIGIPGIEHVVIAANDSRYETTPIEKALKHAFGEDQNLFAGSRDDVQDSAMLQRLTKAAVVTTTLGGTPTVLGNYNRSDDSETAKYHYHRSEKPEHEMKTWEAARATSAAPLFFKPYVHELSGIIFQDGCLYYNNPVRVAMREQKLIWPDRAESCPDIILSVGTGVNEQLARRKPIPKRHRLAFMRTLQNLRSMATDHIQSTLNSEETWRDFMTDSNPAPHLREHYQRLNLRMDAPPPRMDEVTKLEELKDMTMSRMTKDKARIQHLADRLLATSFYFALQAEDTTTNSGMTYVHGTIQCRFPTGPLVRALGEVIEKRTRAAYHQDHRIKRPYFVVQERGRERQAVQVVLEQVTVDAMIENGQFSMPKLEISISDHNAETEILFCFGSHSENTIFVPISGFPRFLAVEAQQALRPRMADAAQVNFVKFSWDISNMEGNVWMKSSAPYVLINDNPLALFSSANYRNPGNAADDAVQNLNDRYTMVREASVSEKTRSVVELPAVNWGSTLYRDEEDWEAALLNDTEMLRMQWLRLLLNPVDYSFMTKVKLIGGFNGLTHRQEAGSSFSGAPGPASAQLYRDKPSIFPPQVYDRWILQHAQSCEPEQLSALCLNRLGKNHPGDTPIELSAERPERHRRGQYMMPANRENRERIDLNYVRS